MSEHRTWNSTHIYITLHGPYKYIMLPVKGNRYIQYVHCKAYLHCMLHGTDGAAEQPLYTVSPAGLEVPPTRAHVG